MLKSSLIGNILLYFLLIVSCNTKKSETEPQKMQSEDQAILLHPAKPAKDAITKVIDSVVNDLPKGISVSGKFVRQETIDNDYFVFIKTSRDTALKLKVSSLFSQAEIEKLQKPNASISSSYIETFNPVSKTMDKNVQLMITNYE